MTVLRESQKQGVSAAVRHEFPQREFYRSKAQTAHSGAVCGGFGSTGNTLAGAREKRLCALRANRRSKQQHSSRREGVQRGCVRCFEQRRESCRKRKAPPCWGGESGESKNQYLLVGGAGYHAI